MLHPCAAIHRMTFSTLSSCKKILTSTLSFLVCLACAYGQATDNPYRTFYNPADRHWTDSLAWGRVVDISGIPGSTNDLRTAIGQDSVRRLGGGVLYFPPGTYSFANGITLRNGVILRGAASGVASAKDSMFSPQTRFVFPKYMPSDTGNGTPNSTAFKRIVTEANASNCGVVDLDINYGGVTLASQTFIWDTLARGRTPRSREHNRNLICMNVRTNNVAAPYGTVPSSVQLGWQRWCSPFVANISIYAYENAVVANCRVNDFLHNGVNPVVNISYPQPGYIAKRNNVPTAVDSGSQAVFSYTNHQGITMNRKETISNAQPWEEPGNFRPGLEIRDNWIYKTMRNGIQCSGSGILVADNVIRDDRHKMIWLDVLGLKFVTNNSATYENRGIDWAGWHVRILRNDIEVERHRFGTSPYSSVDGEGILLQECCGGTSVNGAEIANNRVRDTYIGLWKVRDIFNVHVSDNNTGNGSVLLLANTDGSNGMFGYYRTAYSSVYNNTCNTVGVDGNAGGEHVTITNNTTIDTSQAPCYVQASGNTYIAQYSAVENGRRGRLNYGFAPCNYTYGESIQVTYPDADTVLRQSRGFVDVPLLASPLFFDTLTLWCNAVPVGFVVGAAGSVRLPVPAKKGVYYITAGGYDTSGAYVFSERIRVRVADDILDVKAKISTTPVCRLAPNPAVGETVLLSDQNLSGVTLTDVAGRRVFAPTCCYRAWGCD